MDVGPPCLSGEPSSIAARAIFTAATCGEKTCFGALETRCDTWLRDAKSIAMQKRCIAACRSIGTQAWVVIALPRKRPLTTNDSVGCLITFGFSGVLFGRVLHAKQDFELLLGGDTTRTIWMLGLSAAKCYSSPWFQGCTTSPHLTTHTHTHTHTICRPTCPSMEKKTAG